VKVKELYDYLDSISPFELQEKWDNSGLVIGNMDDQFEKLYISLDLDLEMVEKLAPNSLIITHHPLIFKPLKTINYNDYSSKITKELIKKDIALISMHTNIDKTHLNEYVGKEILGLDFQTQEEFIQVANVDMSFNQLVELIKNKLGMETVKVVESQKQIKSIALTTGSGMSLLPYVKADCFLTGDIKYHEAMAAMANNISLIDIGHFESEVHFCTLLESLLKEYLQKNEKKAIITASQNPFSFK
jgi:dinuclear metal center YbgI/SA1388 family protein